MGYNSKNGRRPIEYASKASHNYIIKDKAVEEFLKNCDLPKNVKEIDLTDHRIVKLNEISSNVINNVIAIDGGYSMVNVKDNFPSSQISFFQFGALIFKLSDLEGLSEKSFIDPEDVATLKKIQRLKLALPTKNIILKNENSLINSVRKTIYDFFVNNPSTDNLINTLKWFLFSEYDDDVLTWNLANCPNCGVSNIKLLKKELQIDYTFKCQHCNETIYLTDVFRLHEAIDNELGAGGILGYVTSLMEQMVLIHLIRIILKIKPKLLNEILFIKDGPLAFFGQTANMFKPMRKLISYLFREHNLYLVGLEKSGPFVEHADEISEKIPCNSILFLDNDYIYKYILPGQSDPKNPYGKTTYYSTKLIFKSNAERIYVATLPTEEIILYPDKTNIKNIDVILNNLQKLKCDMYDSSLIPITLVNKLISLSNHPSSMILEKFAKSKFNK